MFVNTPVVWAYWPFKMLDRLGQQSAVDTKALVNLTPAAARRVSTLGITGVVPSSEWVASVVSQR